MTETKTVFKSKISKGLMLFLGISLGFSFILTSCSPPYWLGSVTILPISFFILHLFLTTDYTLMGHYLIVRCGYFQKVEIDIRTVQSVGPTNNISSAPAFSFDRLEIKYKNQRAVIVSPRQKEQFLAGLLAVNSTIQIKK